MEDLRKSKNESQGTTKCWDKKPLFKFRLDDKMFERSVSFARKLDAAHDHATKMNWHFKNNRMRES